MVGVSRPVYPAENPERPPDKLSGVAAGSGQGDRHRLLILRDIWLEDVGSDVDLNGASEAVLPTELLCSDGDVARHRLFKLLPLRQQAAKGSAGHDLLLVVGHLFQLQAGQASKFPNRPLQHHRKTSADQLGIGSPELLDRANPDILKAPGDLPTNAPDFPHLDRGE